VDGGGIVDGGAALVPADFTRLTVRAGSGDRSAVSPGSTCDGSHIDAYVIDVPTSTLSWDYCGYAAAPAVYTLTQGQLHLSPTQLLGLRMVAATIRPSNSPRCLDSGDYLALDVDAPEGPGRFIDETFACPAGGEPRTVVAHVYELMQEIAKLRPPPGKTDVFIAPDGFVRLSLRSTGGMPVPSDPTSTCNMSYLNTYTVDAAASSLTWDVCSPVATGSTKRAPSQGTCTLARAQLDQVAVALAKIKLSTATACGLDKPTVTLDVETSAGSAQYADDFYACHATNGQAPVSGINDLAYLLPALCPKMP
jgi:hypothetical protein